jgi:glycosyltransferase involved in cell wall biosynthesis
VSIVLPTFNGSRYIAEAINSCLRQDRSDLELVVVDDASEDATPAIVDHLAAHDRRVRIIRHSTNRRLPAALNTGFRAARGDYLTWTSDDNLFRSNAIGEMLEVLQTREDVDIVYTDVTCIDAFGREMYSLPAGPVEELPSRNCIGACFLFRRAVFETLGGYDESLFRAEDYDFWLRASSRFRFLAHAKDLYKYRFHAHSLTTQRPLQARAIVAALQKNLPQLRWLTRSQAAQSYLRLAELCREVGDGPGARSAVYRAWALSPQSALKVRPSLLVGLLFGFSLRDLLKGPGEARKSDR